MPSRSWPPEAITRLREMWPTPMLAREIAGELNVSKNAVLGQARRLGLPHRQSGGGIPITPRRSKGWVPSPDAVARKRVLDRERKQRLREAARAATKPKPERMPGRKRSTSVQPPSALPDMTPDVPRARVRVATKPEACCWPIGEPGRHGFHYCDTPTARLYCAEHAAIAYVPARERAV